MTRDKRSVFAVAVLVALTLAGCGHPSARLGGRKTASVVLETPSPTVRPKRPAAHRAQPTALRRFRDCDAVTGDLRAQALRYVGPFGLPAGGFGSGAGRV